MKVAIAWYGAEGKSSYEYYVANGDDVTIVTPAVSPDFPLPDGAKSILGPDAFNHLNGFDLVIRSAGTRPDALITNGKVWSATNEFFKKCPAPIIGVTGTKGKGTTSSLITSILRVAGNRVHLVGNIGVPPLTIISEITADDIVVFELSSFQLWDIEQSPHIAVVLMIEPDHLNVHTDMQEYVNAKANIRRFQSVDDICYYHPNNQYAYQIANVSNGHDNDSESFAWAAKACRYAVPDDGAVYVQNNFFMAHGEPICPVEAVQLPGEFNIENACAAISVARHYTVDGVAIEQGLRAFTGLPHRLKLVGEKNGVKYYDDSIATTPGSAIAALMSFAGPKVIILGGEGRGVHYDNVIAVAKQHEAKIIAIGQVGHEIELLATAQEVPVRYVDGLMKEAVQAAAEYANGSGIVLLSPAATSFGQYKNYADRGEQFIAAVNEL